MQKRIIIITALISAFLLALLHELALRLSWYYFYPSIDIPIHTVGGFAVGLLVYLVLVQAFQRHDLPRLPSGRQLFMIVFGTLIVSVVWEVLELIFYLTNDAGLSQETLKDVIFGAVGAMLAWSFIQLLPRKPGRAEKDSMV